MIVVVAQAKRRQADNGEGFVILSCDNLQAPGLVAISRALVTKSAKGCCQELLGNEKHVVLHGKSIITLFYGLFFGGW